MCFAKGHRVPRVPELPEKYILLPTINLIPKISFFSIFHFAPNYFSKRVSQSSQTIRNVHFSGTIVPISTSTFLSAQESFHISSATAAVVVWTHVRSFIFRASHSGVFSFMFSISHPSGLSSRSLSSTSTLVASCNRSAHFCFLRHLFQQHGKMIFDSLFNQFECYSNPKLVELWLDSIHAPLNSGMIVFNLVRTVPNISGSDFQHKFLSTMCKDCKPVSFTKDYWFSFFFSKTITSFLDARM